MKWRIYYLAAQGHSLHEIQTCWTIADVMAAIDASIIARRLRGI